MYFRRVKRKCSVRGCKNTDCFAISRVREVGNTIIVCEQCMADALKEIKEATPGARENVKKQTGSQIPPLFFGGSETKEAVKKQGNITARNKAKKNDKEEQ